MILFLPNKCDDFDFEIVNFPFVDGDVLALLPIIFLISSDLLEHITMLLTSTFEINC